MTRFEPSFFHAMTSFEFCFCFFWGSGASCGALPRPRVSVTTTVNKYREGWKLMAKLKWKELRNKKGEKTKRVQENITIVRYHVFRTVSRGSNIRLSKAPSSVALNVTHFCGGYIFGIENVQVAKVSEHS